MHATLPLLQFTGFPRIHRATLDTLQVNLGYRCNQQCVHCHVNAAPQREEIMDRETIELVLAAVRAMQVGTLDLTGGAPELNPHFRDLVRAADNMGVKIINRCNLTILEETGHEDLADLLAAHHVEVAASLPCYLQENVDRQRGPGVFEKSMRALKRLNRLGYGRPDSGLTLNLVFNPQGPALPAPQAALEEAYRRELGKHYGIIFNHLLTIANMPIKRFGSTLVSKGQFGAYMELLKRAHRPENVERVMCRTLVSVDWRGYVYDCDFNQQLGIPLGGGRTHLSELLQRNIAGQTIAVADHCYGCTAGQGSSCGGAF